MSQARSSKNLSADDSQATLRRDVLFTLPAVRSLRKGSQGVTIWILYLSVLPCQSSFLLEELPFLLLAYLIKSDEDIPGLFGQSAQNIFPVFKTSPFEKFLPHNIAWSELRRQLSSASPGFQKAHNTLEYRVSIFAFLSSDLISVIFSSETSCLLMTNSKAGMPDVQFFRNSPREACLWQVVTLHKTETSRLPEQTHFF